MQRNGVECDHGAGLHLTVGDEHFAEQFPLSPLDDYLIHQTPDPIRVMWTGDFRAYERYWMVCHDPAGEVLVATGGSFYPNLDRAEAFAIVSHGGRHVTVRGFRPLGVDPPDDDRAQRFRGAGVADVRDRLALRHLSARLNAGNGLFGQGDLLSAVAAVVIGGASLSGGVGSVIGTTIGVLIIATIEDGLVLLNVPDFWQQIVVGGFIVGAVMVDQIAKGIAKVED